MGMWDLGLWPTGGGSTGGNLGRGSDMYSKLWQYMSTLLSPNNPLTLPKVPTRLDPSVASESNRAAQMLASLKGRTSTLLTGGLFDTPTKNKQGLLPKKTSQNGLLTL